MTKLPYNHFKFKLPETPNDIQLTSLECTKKSKLPNYHTPSILSKWPKTQNTFSKDYKHSPQIGPNDQITISECDLTFSDQMTQE